MTIKTESLCKQEGAVWEAAALQMHSMHAQASTAINFKWQIHENWMKTCAFHWCRFSGFTFAVCCVTGSSKNDFWMSLVFNLFSRSAFGSRSDESPLVSCKKLFLLQFKSRRNPIWSRLEFKFRLADGLEKDVLAGWQRSGFNLNVAEVLGVHFLQLLYKFL